MPDPMPNCRRVSVPIRVRASPFRRPCEFAPELYDDLGDGMTGGVIVDMPGIMYRRTRSLPIVSERSGSASTFVGVECELKRRAGLAMLHAIRANRDLRLAYAIMQKDPQPAGQSLHDYLA